jgi:hypothetical protein
LHFANSKNAQSATSAILLNKNGNIRYLAVASNLVWYTAVLQIYYICSSKWFEIYLQPIGLFTQHHLKMISQSH